MKNSQYNVNPARGTRWSIVKQSTVFNFTVIGIISKGAGCNYEVISYELKYDHREDPQVIPAEKLLSLIDIKEVCPCWNAQGSMLAEGYN